VGLCSWSWLNYYFLALALAFEFGIWHLAFGRDWQEVLNQKIDPNKNGNRSKHIEIVQTNGNRSKQMEIDPNKWKSIQTNGNRPEQMEIDPNKWKSVRKNGNRSNKKRKDSILDTHSI
jgi:hypothetical protein